MYLNTKTIVLAIVTLGTGTAVMALIALIGSAIGADVNDRVVSGTSK